MEKPLYTALLFGCGILIGVLSYRRLLQLRGRGRGRASSCSGLLAVLAVAGVAIWFPNANTDVAYKHVLRGAAAAVEEQEFSSETSKDNVTFQTKYFGLYSGRTYLQIVELYRLLRSHIPTS